MSLALLLAALFQGAAPVSSFTAPTAPKAQVLQTIRDPAAGPPL